MEFYRNFYIFSAKISSNFEQNKFVKCDLQWLYANVIFSHGLHRVDTVFMHFWTYVCLVLNMEPGDWTLINIYGIAAYG